MIILRLNYSRISHGFHRLLKSSHASRGNGLSSHQNIPVFRGIWISKRAYEHFFSIFSTQRDPRFLSGKFSINKCVVFIGRIKKNSMAHLSWWKAMLVPWTIYKTKLGNLHAANVKFDAHNFVIGQRYVFMRSSKLKIWR